VQRLLASDPAAAAARDEQGLSPIVRCSYRGRTAILDELRAIGPLDGWDRLMLGESEDIPAPDAWSPDGFTPLHLAAFAHNAAAAERLLDDGADPNVVARAAFARVTPLGTCAFAGAADVARVLLRHGANPSLSETEGGTPLAAARANGYDALVALLVVALAHGDLDGVRAALDEDATLANATIDWGNGDWESALGAAAHMHRRDIAELLLAHGARLDVFAAAMLGDIEVVRAALEAHPEMRHAKGPHGIPLEAHAQGAVVDLFA
jgi:Ankyrin repeat